MDQTLLNQRIIGASDAPVIMKLFPYGKTPYQLWEEKIYGKENSVNSSMEYGNRMEEPARQWFENKLGLQLFGDHPVKHPEKAFMTATLDGIDLDRTTILEIKNTNEEYHEMVKSNVAPDIFFCQVQHQLEIVNKLFGIKKAYLGTRHKGDHALMEIPLDEGYIKNMLIPEEELFYMENVLKKIPPMLTEKDDVSMEGNARWKRIAKDWKHAYEMRKKYEEDEDAYRELLIQMTEGKNSRGEGIKVSKYACKGSVDYSKIPELKGVDIEVYRKKEIQKWRISFS